jgi:predicted transcriptional regulator
VIVRLSSTRTEQLARLVAARHIAAMSTALATQAAKPPRPLRRAHGSVVIPPEQFAAWHRLAAATAGLSDRELRVLARLCQHFRQLHEKGEASVLSYNKIGFDLDIEPDRVNAAVRSLVDKGLLGIQKRGAGRSYSYRMTLPRKLAATLPAAPVAVAGDDIPPF